MATGSEERGPDTGKESKRSLKEIGAAIAKKSCSILMGLALLSFVGLAAFGHSGKINLFHVAELSVEPSERSLPAACKPLLAEAEKLRVSLGQESHRLDLLEQAVLEFERNFAVPNQGGFWGAADPNDKTKWGPGIYEDVRQWTVITEQRQIFAASADKLSGVLGNIEKRCEL